MSYFCERLLRPGFFVPVFLGLAGPAVEGAPPALKIRSSVGLARGVIRSGDRHPIPTTVSDTIRLSLPRKATGGTRSQSDAISHLEELLAVFKQNAHFEPGFEKSYRSIGSWLEGKFLVQGPKIHFEFPQNPLAPPRGRYRSDADRRRVEQTFERICTGLVDADLPALWGLESQVASSRARRALERLVEVYTQGASAFLESRGIPHRIMSVGGRDAASLRIVISPGRRASPLNRFAASMQERGFETIVDPGGMILDATGGWMSAGERVIAVSHRDLLRGTISRELAALRAADLQDLSLTARSIRESGGAPLGSVSLHEIRHYSQLRKLEQGEASILHGEFQSAGDALPGSRPEDAYADFLAADELDAYYFEARVDARRLQRVLELPDSDAKELARESILGGLSHLAAQGTELADRVESLSRLALERLASGGRGSIEWSGGRAYVKLDLAGHAASRSPPWEVRFPIRSNTGENTSFGMQPKVDVQQFLRERLSELELHSRLRARSFELLERALLEISGQRSKVLRSSQLRSLPHLLPAESGSGSMIDPAVLFEEWKTLGRAAVRD